MAKDYRKKGCPNEGCERNKKKYYYKSTDMYCTICGKPLVYVCKDCFSRIADTDIKHIRCELCEAKRVDKKDKMVNKKNAAVGAVAVMAAGIAKAAQVEVIKEGGDWAKDAVKAGFDVAKKIIKK